MEKIIEILDRIKPNVNWKEESDFINKGLLTSLEIVKLMVELSEAYDIEISPVYIVPDNFRSIETIYDMVKKIEEED